MTQFLRRSEYHHALDLARKARRRGDVLTADRWLRHAERRLVLDEKNMAFNDADRLRSMKLDAAQASVRQAQTPPYRHVCEQLDEIVEDYRRSLISDGAQT